MAPRDPESNENYKENKLTEEPLDPDDFTPVLLHKKHKVVKLVEYQLRKIRTEGLVCCDKGIKSEKIKEKPDEIITVDVTDSDYHEESHPRCILKMLFFILKLLFLLLLILLVVWIAAGPLSNKSPHTPISLWNSLITTDNSCTLERKYLLRWSVSDYGE